jgi:transposase
MGFVAARLELTAEDRGVLEHWLASPTISQAMAMRAKVVLAGADGEAVRATARRLGTSMVSVCHWRKRYAQEGLAGLQTRRMSGRPRVHGEVVEERIVTATMRAPKVGTHWSTRKLAKEMGVSRGTVHRIWQKRGLQPHRVETFKFSTDPQFDEKLTDIVGLYLDPPERALILCVDEKSQIQALERTQPILPLRPGLPARMTHDYERHGTTTLFAALEVATGKVHGKCFPRHTHKEFVAFLDGIAKKYRKRDIHLICDNYGTHKHPEVRKWLEAHPNFRLHFTPTSASWLNLVERWFAMITEEAIRRGSFESLRQLESAITRYLAHWNENAKPFVWTKTADQIRWRIQRAKATYGTKH